MTIGSNIKNLRKVRKITRKEFGRRAGVNYRTLENIEQGRCNPTIDNVKKIAECMRVPIDLLACDDPSKGMCIFLPEEFLKIMANPEVNQFLSDFSFILDSANQKKKKH